MHVRPLPSERPVADTEFVDNDIEHPRTELDKRMDSLEAIGLTRAPQGPYLARMLDPRRGWRELAAIPRRRRLILLAVIAMSLPAGVAFAVFVAIRIA
jgi:hypothetical protein